MIQQFVLKIKRKSTPFYAFLYQAAKFVLTFNLPSLKFIHLPLYYLHTSLVGTIKQIFFIFWSCPLFKARCERVGNNLRLPNGMPYVYGGNLKLYVGNNVTFMKSTIGASKVYDSPILQIGNNTVIGYGVTISVSQKVIIGDNCMIAPGVIIMDSDDHPIDPQKRLLGLGVSKEEIVPVQIGNNVWIGSNSVILKGVAIGDNTIIATHSVVTRNAEANCVYAGYPARPTMRDIDKVK